MLMAIANIAVDQHSDIVGHGDALPGQRRVVGVPQAAQRFDLPSKEARLQVRRLDNLAPALAVVVVGHAQAAVMKPCQRGPVQLFRRSHALLPHALP